MNWPWEWRPIKVIVSVAAYAAVMHWTLIQLRDAAAPGSQAIRLAYMASAGSVGLAGLMWSPEPARNAVEGLRTLGVTPLGIVVVAGMAGRGQGRAGEPPIARTWHLLAIGFVIFVIFALVLGRGLGPLATAVLRRWASSERQQDP